MAVAVPALPPGPRPFWPFAAIRQFRRDAPAYLLRLRREYGDVVFLRLGGQDVYFLNHPDLVKDVLVNRQNHFTKSRVLQRSKRFLGEGLLTSEGELHLRQRRLMQPAFHRDRLRGYAASMVEWGVRVREQWRPGETIDVGQEMMRLTLGVVAQTLFSANVDEEAGDVREAMTAILDLFNIVLLPYSELLEKLPLPAVKRYQKARDTLDRVIYRIIGERRAAPVDKGDLLSMLLLAQDDDGSGGMSDRQVRDEALTLFLAGHETTANALTWTWMLLSQHPEAEARFHAEIDSLEGRLPTFDDLPRLQYVEHVLAEAMRLFPPAWAIGRKCVGPHTIGDYEAQDGDIILLSPFVMHRDSRYWPEPDRFDPDRWRPEIADARPKFSYFPFGGGSRVCVGERFAWMEGVLLLTVLGQRFRLRLTPGHPMDHKAVITLRPKAGVNMTVEPRQS